MENLLPHYEHELMRLRRSAREFAARNPKTAARLALSGEHSEDPHIERMLQSFALLGARIDTRLVFCPRRNFMKRVMSSDRVGLRSGHGTTRH